MIRGEGTDILWREGWVGEEGSLTAHRSIHTDTLCVNTQPWCVPGRVCAGPGLSHPTCPIRSLSGTFMLVQLSSLLAAFSSFQLQGLN